MRFTTMWFYQEPTNILRTGLSFLAFHIFHYIDQGTGINSGLKIKCILHSGVASFIQR